MIIMIISDRELTDTEKELIEENFEGSEKFYCKIDKETTTYRDLVSFMQVIDNGDIFVFISVIPQLLKMVALKGLEFYVLDGENLI